MEQTKSPPLLKLAIFNGLYLLISIIAVSILRNKEFLFYIVTMLMLIGAVMMIHRRMPLSSAQLWALSLWGLLHMMGGLVPVPESWPINGEQRVLYSWWLIPQYLKYDQVIHAYGFGVTTWLCWQGLRHHIGTQNTCNPTIGKLVLCAAGGMGFGALNEVIEFIAVLSIPNTNVGGYVNTGFDLVSNLVGCVIAAALIRRKILA